MVEVFGRRAHLPVLTFHGQLPVWLIRCASASEALARPQRFFRLSPIAVFAHRSA